MMRRFLPLLLLGVASADMVRIDHREGTSGNYSPVPMTTTPGHVITFDAEGRPIIAAVAGGSGSVATDTLWDAVGDLAVGSGLDIAVRLAKGTALQVLRVNAAGTALEWAAASGGAGLADNNTWTGTNTFANVTASAASVWNLTAATVSLGTLTTLPVTSIELGHATANTLTAASGVLSIEGQPLLTAAAIDTLAELDAATQLPVEFCVAMSDETTVITTGTAKVTMRAPYAFTLTGVRASVNTVSSSGLPTVDINEGAGAGTTVLSTKLTIDASEFTSVTAAAAAVISDSAIADDAQLTFDIDVAGTGAKGLKVWVYGYR
jgi:hypothetical protein